MIGGATSGTGGGALGRHLADTKGHNVRTEFGESRHLGSDDLKEAVAELSQSVAGSASPKPIYHVHADPAPTDAMSEDRWADYWGRMETEFGLQDQAFVEARHWTWRTLEPHEATPEKLARVTAVHGADNVRQLPAGGVEVLMEHRHRAYSRVREDGTLVSLSHDHARREKLNRTFEHDHGFDLTKGAHNRTVAHTLKAEGRADVAAAMEAAGLLDGPRPRAKTTPTERAQQERTGIRKDTVQAAAAAAWASADSPKAREAAFAAAGLALAVGRDGKTPVLIDAAGGIHGLRRTLGMKAKDVRDGIDGLRLPTAEAVQQGIKEAGKSPLKVRFAHLKGGGNSVEQETKNDRAEGKDRHAEDGQGRRSGETGGSRGRKGEEGNPADHRDADRTREGRGAESSGRDSRNPGKDARVFERPRNASRLDRIHARAAEARFVQAGHGPRLQSLADKLKASTAQPVAQRSAATPAKGAAKSDSAPTASVGRNPTGGGGGNSGGRSTDSIIKGDHGLQEAGGADGGGDETPIADGIDPNEWVEFCEALERHRRSAEAPEKLHRYAKTRETCGREHPRSRAIADQAPASANVYEKALAAGADVSSLASAKNADQAMKRLQQEAERLRRELEDKRRNPTKDDTMEASRGYRPSSTGGGVRPGR